MTVQVDIDTCILLADCTAVCSRMGIGMILSSVCLSVYDAVHCGTHGQCRGLKSCASCSLESTSYLLLQTLLSVYRFATKHSKWLKCWWASKSDLSLKNWNCK